jgi:hypothetical protein
MKIFTYHSEQYKKELGILRRDIQNETIGPSMDQIYKELHHSTIIKHFKQH